MTKRFERLTDEQLVGAHYGLRLARTSPSIVGKGLGVLGMLIEEAEATMIERSRRIAPAVQPLLEAPP